MPYASSAELTAFVQSEVEATTADLMLKLASGAVNTTVGESLEEGSRTELFKGGGNTIWVVPAGWPLTVESVTNDGAILTTDDYRVTADGSVERVGGVWGRLVEIIYTTGFADGSPEMATAKRITLEAASRALANPQDLDSLNTDGTSMNFRRGAGPVSLSRDHKADLAPLRWRRRVA